LGSAISFLGTYINLRQNYLEHKLRQKYGRIVGGLLEKIFIKLGGRELVLHCTIEPA
jgi:hypothetical protein